MIFETKMGATEYRTDDEFLTKVRKAIALTDLVVPPYPGDQGYEPTERLNPASIALADVYTDAVALQHDPVAFAMKVVGWYADPEDTALFKMFWADRGSKDGAA